MENKKTKFDTDFKNQLQFYYYYIIYGKKFNNFSMHCRMVIGDLYFSK